MQCVIFEISFIEYSVLISELTITVFHTVVQHPLKASVIWIVLNNESAFSFPTWNHLEIVQRTTNIAVEKGRTRCNIVN